MTSLEQHAADYLRIRRALGFKLERAEKLLAQYLAHLDRAGQNRVTVENALQWAALPTAGSRGSWWAFRLSTVRCFAIYLHAVDPAHEVPPPDALPRRIRRAVPYLYTDQEIWALMTASDRLHSQLRQATYRTLIGLLAVTGMRVGEVIRLDPQVVAQRRDRRGASSESPVSCRCTSACRWALRRSRYRQRLGDRLRQQVTRC
jgi:integrase/recombinase XerD